MLGLEPSPKPVWMPEWLDRVEVMSPEALLDQADWHRDHADVPIVLLSLYVTFVFGMPAIMKRAALSTATTNALKTAFAMWNLLLSVFSIRGAMVLLPHLWHVVQERGFTYSVCANPEVWHGLLPRVGPWVMIFIYSKLPELMDTVFLVLRGKPVIFLHWSAAAAAAAERAP